MASCTARNILEVDVVKVENSAPIPKSTYTSRHADVGQCLKSLEGWAAGAF